MKFARIQGRPARRVGITLMVSSLAVGIFAPVSATAVDELPAERVDVEVSRSAYWNGDASETTPTALTKQFPPEAVCLVAPNLCSFPTGEDDPSSGLPTSSLEPVTGSEEDGLGPVGNALIDQMNAQYKESVNNVQGNDPGSPAEPVPDNGLPVSVAFGQAYYRSALEFPLPEVPAGDSVDSFIVAFSQGNPTYSNASPALRQAVLATLTCAREGDAPAINRCESEEFEKIAARDLRDGEPLPFSLCPIAMDPLTGDDKTTWENGESPYDEETLPSANCLIGGRAESFTEGDATVWAFDMTFALNSWNDGSVPYNGMLLIPGAADNFAFGDAETTYSKQVTLLSDTVSYALATSAAPEPPPAFGGGGFAPPPSQPGISSPPSMESEDLFGTPPTPTSDSPVAVPQPAAPDVTSEQPAVADGAQSPAVSQPTDDLAATPAAVPQGSAWYVWLLVPIFLAGAYLLSRSLEQEAVLATARGGGAMTRLLERKAAQRGPDLVTG